LHSKVAAGAACAAPTYLDRPTDGVAYVLKPVLGREGGGLEVLDSRGDVVAHGAGRRFDAQPCVFQRYVTAPVRRVDLSDDRSKARSC
jgi:glutathionylspermidine synthase